MFLIINAICRIAVKREAAVSKEVLKELNDSASGKKLTKLEKDEK